MPALLSATGSPETGLGEDLLASGLPSIFSPPACDTQQPTVRGGGGRTVQRERERGGEEGRKKKRKEGRLIASLLAYQDLASN